MVCDVGRLGEEMARRKKKGVARDWHHQQNPRLWRKLAGCVASAAHQCAFPATIQCMHTLC